VPCGWLAQIDIAEEYSMTTHALRSARFWVPVVMALATAALLLCGQRAMALGLGLLIPPVAVLGLGRLGQVRQ
jgi:hypothetical protein